MKVLLNFNNLIFLSFNFVKLVYIISLLLFGFVSWVLLGYRRLTGDLSRILGLLGCFLFILLGILLLLLIFILWFVFLFCGCLFWVFIWYLLSFILFVIIHFVFTIFFLLFYYLFHLFLNFMNILMLPLNLIFFSQQRLLKTRLNWISKGPIFLSEQWLPFLNIFTFPLPDKNNNIDKEPKYNKSTNPNNNILYIRPLPSPRNYLYRKSMWCEQIVCCKG